MFLFSSRVGKLADRYGPRPFLIVGPFLVAAGFGLMQRYGTSVSFFGDVVPAMLVFSFGLALTVAPLTATVLADVDEADAGIASAVNNAIARTAALISICAVGAVASGYYAHLLDQRLGGRLPAYSQPAVLEAKRRTFGVVRPSAVPPAQRKFVAQAASAAAEDAFHLAVGIGSGLLALAGFGGFLLQGRRETEVAAEGCPAGQIVGAPLAAGDCEPVVAAAASG